MSDDRFSPWQFVASCFTLSSLAGLAQLLRSDSPLTWRAITSTALYSGLFGAAIGLASMTSLAESQSYVLAVSLLAGLGANSVLDFIVAAVGRGGITIIVKQKDE